MGNIKYRDLKVGQLATLVLGPMLENGTASQLEIAWMQDTDYSKRYFGLNYPLLVKVGSSFNEARYYKKILNIYGLQYRMCSQWFETETNNDRIYLEKWIDQHESNSYDIGPSDDMRKKETRYVSGISRWAHLKTSDIVTSDLNREYPKTEFNVAKDIANGPEACQQNPESDQYILNTEEKYSNLKIGKLASTVLWDLLESGSVSETEIEWMQRKDYSKTHFDLQFPLLVRIDSSFDNLRYYKKILVINGVKYRMCSQWFEVEANNDRPYLEKWLRNHGVDI